MNKKILYLLVLSILYCGQCFGNDSLIQNDNQSDPNDYISQGEKYAAENNLSEALEALKKAVQIEPENVNAHLGMAKVYARLRAYDKAVNEFEIGIKLDPNVEVSVLPNLITIYLFKEDLIRLKNCLQRLRERDMHVYGMLQGLIITARTYGIFEAEYGLGIEVPHPSTPSNEYYELSEKASHLMESKGPYEAIKMFQDFIIQAKVSNVDKAFAYNELGKVYLNYGNPIQGIENLKKSTEIFPDYLFWRQELTTTLISTQLYTEALEETERILSISPDNKFGLYAQGIIYNEFGMIDKAIKSWESLKSRDKFIFALAEDSYQRAKSNLSNKH